MSDDNDSVTMRVMHWLLGNDTGLSSKAIVETMICGAPGKNRCHPADGGDLGRCLRLLRVVPEWVPRLGEMKAVSPQWAALVEHWDELARMHAAGERGIYERMHGLLYGDRP